MRGCIKFLLLGVNIVCAIVLIPIYWPFLTLAGLIDNLNYPKNIRIPFLRNQALIFKSLWQVTIDI